MKVTSYELGLIRHRSEQWLKANRKTRNPSNSGRAAHDRARLLVYIEELQATIKGLVELTERPR